MSTYEELSVSGFQEKVLAAYINGEISAADAIDSLRTSRSQFYRIAQASLAALDHLIADAEQLSLVVLRLGEQQQRGALEAERAQLTAQKRGPKPKVLCI